MRQKSGLEESVEKHVKAIRRKTRRKFSREDKIRIVLEGLRGEYSIAESGRLWGAQRLELKLFDDRWNNAQKPCNASIAGLFENRSVN